MKNQLTKIAMLGMILASAVQAHAGRILSDYDSGEFYITSLDGCWASPGGRTKPFYMGVYINRQPGRKYDSYADQRVYLWLNACPAEHRLNNWPPPNFLNGKRVYLQLKPSVYSPGNWEPDIANLNSFEDLKNAAMPQGIEFVNQDEIGEDVILKITSSTAVGATIGGRTSNGEIRIEVSINRGTLSYYNSSSQRVFTQDLNSDELRGLQKSLDNPSSVCPAEITVSRKQRRVTKVVSKCVPFAQAPNTNPEA